MNNNQFRNLLSNTPARQQNDPTPNAQAKATSSALGAKKSSFMPMTPRNVQGGMNVDFARQVRERNAALKPAKKFKSSAPKGVKYGEGYTDRARAREGVDDDAEGSKAGRIKALEEQMKLGQISQETFEALREEITGGDISSTHLVKGLDRKLLDRVRRGEDVLGNGSGGEPAPDVDEELDKLEEKEVTTVRHDTAEKKGTMAPPSFRPGVKRSRDEIMAELKAHRKAMADAKPKVQLDGRWRKTGEAKSKIEIDHKGRQVLITVDEDGNFKKKVRKVTTQPEKVEGAKEDMLDVSKAVLGADVQVPDAIIPPPADEEEDDDIFEGVGTEYNPLGDEEDEEEDDGDEETEDEAKKPATSAPEHRPDRASEESSAEESEAEERESPPDPASTDLPSKRNYFNDAAATDEEVPKDRFAGIQNVLQKAAKLDTPNDADDDLGSDEEAKEARRQKRAKMLAQQDRDMDDMDIGFGGSRMEDEEDGAGEGSKIRLSEWKGSAGGGEEDGGKGRGDKKKRKPKKRKGDVNNAADIMRVIEGRGGAGK